MQSLNIPKHALLNRLQQQEAILQVAYQQFSNTPRVQIAPSSAAEWILDNFLLLQQTFRQIRENMPPGFYRQLPKLSAGPLAGYPRVYGIAHKLIIMSRAQLDMARGRRFVHLYQDFAPLTTGELWALPIMLRLGLVEFLTQAISRILQLPKGDLLPDITLRHPLTDNEIVANCITSLWTLTAQNWQDFFENMSRVEQILRHDPANIYSHMDFESRDRYRGVIEGIALAGKQDEQAVAQKAIELAEEEFAKSKESDETRIPRMAHVGYYLLDAEGYARLEASLGYHPPWNVRLVRWLRKRPIVWYLGGIASFSLLILLGLVSYASTVGGTLIQLIIITLLASVPTSAVAVDFINWLVTHTVSPHPWPRLNFQEEGVPAEFRTMVVIPALLATERDMPFLIRQIEHHFLANTDPNIFFALITDFADAPEKEIPGDLQLVAHAQDAIERLNEKYGKEDYRPFYFFHRERTWNPGEECWMGWERKRGKLEEFNKLLRGNDSTTFIVQIGDPNVLTTIRYVITLDADTLLPRESARRLIGTLAHPLNQPEFDSASKQIKAGYTVLQPRVQVRPVVANQSLFTRVYSGDSTLDLYTRAVSDVYQDLFGEGSYIGKGIYDVDSFQTNLKDQVPDNHLLSHDLFEGMHTRCGLVTDVVLFEDYPPHYLAYTDRLHRWVRGDWQLLPWLAKQVPHRTKGKVANTLSLIDRWKILDNLRRSLLSPMVLALFISGWLFLPGGGLIWMIVALSPYLIPIITNFIADLQHAFFREPSSASTHPLPLAALRALLEIIFLPHEALVILDAIATALIRMFILHKRMLEWVTAAHTVQMFGRRLKIKAAWQAMVAASAFALILFLLLLALNPQTLFVAAPFLLSWVVSPYIAVRISRPYSYKREKLTPTQEKQLRLLARATWLYFEHFVGPEDHWLPPDHFQEEPRGIVAHRTSPTNIGLFLLSTLSVYDLGYIGPRELALRIRNTFDGMDKLEKQRDQFLNWYDTRTLNPLLPRYISTVDNGNLAASLITLRQGCLDVLSGPIIRWDGLIDTLDMLDITLHEAHLGSVANELHDAISYLREQVEGLRETREDTPKYLMNLFHEGRTEMEELLAKVVEASAERLDSSTIRRLSTWIERTRYHLHHIQRDMEDLYPWPLMLAKAPSIFDQPNMHPDLAYAWTELRSAFSFRPPLEVIPAVCEHAVEVLQRLRALLGNEEQDAIAWCDSLANQLQAARATITELLNELQKISARAEAYFQALNFKFLFEPRLQVFYLGYNIDTERPDAYHYGLLASESRIASLLAIAKGDVPQSHWLHLGRPLTRVDGMRALLSWSGTMFEYLMPSLLTRNYEGTLLDQSDHAAVERQIAYARQKGVPWGISESAYYHFDAAMNYQYGPFGVPGLGIKPRMGEDTVIAPYASLLALHLRPQAVMNNLARFEKLNMWGIYGLYESVDFTPERLKAGEHYAIIRSYMAHHQGMILISLCNYIFNRLMVRRFHADPLIESVELLLQEQIPAHAPTEHLRPQPTDSLRGLSKTISLGPWSVSPDTPYPQVHCLSNGNYNLLITAAGSGYSSWREVDLTRWRADTTLDHYGTWVYVQDLQADRWWSASHQPAAAPPDKQNVRFYPHAAEFRRRDGDISTQMRITIAPDADVEIRHIILSNHSGSTRELALTSYAEIILSPQAVDRRHPAYNKLFVESEYLADENILLFRRRPRSAREKPVYLAHFIVAEEDSLKIIRYETDRRRFLGRGHTPRDPATLRTESLLSNIAATLDPIFSLQAQVSIPGHESYQLAFITLAASSRSEAMTLALRYRQWHYVGKAFGDARKQMENELSKIGLSSLELEQTQKLLSALLYPSAALRSDPAILASNSLGQSGLWPFGISGDYPILLVSLKEEKDLALLDGLLRGHRYWRRRGLMIDLVVLNKHETSYDGNFQERIHRLLSRTNSDNWLSKRGGIFILKEDQISKAEQTLLATVARVVLDSEAGSLLVQLRKLDQAPLLLPNFVPILPARPEVSEAPPLKRPSGLLLDNGMGGFTPDGREYVIYLERGQWTPSPWTNVISNPEFGFLVSEAGMGCTWAINSGENRLTPWHNDPVSDPPSEAIYLRDEDTGQIWSPTPLPARADSAYLIHHGTGYSIFEHQSHELDQKLKIFAAPNDPVKIAQLKLKNTSSLTRRINITYYAEWVLGTTHENTAQYIVPEFASNNFALLASNPYNQDFSKRVAFLAATRELQGLTTDRREFLGSLGSYARPEALERVGLTASARAGGDPCAAIQLLLWLSPGETKEVTFLLGQGADRADALKLINQYQNLSQIRASWKSLASFWDERIGRIQIKTPDKAMDLLVNRWLPYQALSCRIWGRTAFYQSGGAYGFRDQLQDVLAFAYTRPEIARQHILNAASHQFEEGDVLHWWHPPTNRGIRSRISDNMLWLPYVTAQYIQVTDDRTILDEEIPFLSAEPLKPDEHERYGEFPSLSSGTLYEHCCRAINKGSTQGPHGLPLIGEGDWNDGMNNIGAGGQGESVWLGWFLYSTLMNFASICDLVSDSSQSASYREQAKTFRAALEAHGWDGSWYRRAYYDDGKPVGSKENRDCQIDSISQSWGVISGAADPERARIAMESLYERLVRRDDSLILLLTPPFDRTIRDPGYIKGYLPGIRENGGQYTHAALWAIWAFAELGQAERVYELLRLINPIFDGDTPEKVERYRVEPYVIPADVYSIAPYTGRGGWTWYTGSASWMMRLVLEKVLGLHREGNNLSIKPCIPAEWRDYEIHYRFGNTMYHMHVENPEGVHGSVIKLTLDGNPLQSESLLLSDDGREHHVVVTLGRELENLQTEKRKGTSGNK